LNDKRSAIVPWRSKLERLVATVSMSFLGFSMRNDASVGP
jgi:hypothetical protein